MPAFVGLRLHFLPLLSVQIVLDLRNVRGDGLRGDIVEVAENAGGLDRSTLVELAATQRPPLHRESRSAGQAGASRQSCIEHRHDSLTESLIAVKLDVISLGKLYGIGVSHTKRHCATCDGRTG